MTAPAANSTPPANVLARAVSDEITLERVSSRHTPRRYMRTNTQGTGTRISSRNGFCMFGTSRGFPKRPFAIAVGKEAYPTPRQFCEECENTRLRAYGTWKKRRAVPRFIDSYTTPAQK